MTFQIRNLAALTYAQGFTMWAYRGAPDSLAAIGAPGYFKDAGAIMAPGDLIVARGLDLRGRPRTQLLVVATTAETVTVENLKGI
jgi:hypothetical protein